MNEPIRTAAISPLRQRMIDDMNMRRFSRETQRNYIRDVGRFATFLGRSPDTATADDVRQFQIEQREAGVPTPTMNSIVSALRFFFTQTIDRPDLARKLVRAAHPRNLPVVLSRDEVARLLNATTWSSIKPPSRWLMAPACAWRRSQPEGHRCRQRAHAAAGRAWQGRALPQRHAPSRSADLAAGVVEGRAAAGRHAPTRLAVPGSGRDAAGQHAAPAPDRRRGGAERRRSPSGSGRTRCGTASRRICWKTASISASSRSCSVTSGSTPPRSTPRSPRARCAL